MPSLDAAPNQDRGATYNAAAPEQKPRFAEVLRRTLRRTALHTTQVKDLLRRTAQRCFAELLRKIPRRSNTVRRTCLPGTQSAVLFLFPIQELKLPRQKVCAEAHKEALRKNASLLLAMRLQGIRHKDEPKLANAFLKQANSMRERFNSGSSRVACRQVAGNPVKKKQNRLNE